MNVREVGLNIKKGLIKSLKTCKLRYLVAFTIVMAFVISGNIANAISKSVKMKSLKDGLTKYIDYSNVVKIVIPNIYIRQILFFLVVLIWFLIWYFRVCYKEPIEKLPECIFVIGHSTLGKSQFRLNKKSQENTKLVTEEINLIEDVKNVGENYEDLKYVVSKQDDLIKSFKDKINNDDRYGYMGISHTPLIFRAGYVIGDETNFVMFHKKRNFDYYEELNDSELYTPIRIEEKNIKKDCDELIVAISTTFPIQDNQLSILQPENRSIIKFKTDELGYDVIISKKQVEQYIRFIRGEIRKILIDKEIVRIHMTISSSVAFTFALGQGISSQYDPEIIIYHFDINKPKKYPWGIALFKDSGNCIVVN